MTTDRGQPGRGAGPTRRRVLSLVGSGVAGALAGCGYRPGGGDVRWRTDRASGVAQASEVGVAGGRLFAVDRSIRGYDFDTDTWYTRGEVTAYRTDGAMEYWEATVESTLSAQAVAADGAAVGFADSIVRFDADGERWQASIDGTPRSLTLTDDRVYAVTDGSALLALSDGAERWSVSLDPQDGTESPDDRPRPEPAVAASGDLLVCSTPAGLRGFDPDGSRRWTRDDVAVWSVVVGEGIALAAAESRLLALDPSSGETRWHLERRPGALAPAFTADGVYVRSDDSLVAFQRDGTRRWSHPLAGHGPTGSVAAGPRNVYVADDDGLAALDEGGDVRWRASYDRVAVGPFHTENGVIVAADGNLVCHVP